MRQSKNSRHSTSDDGNNTAPSPPRFAIRSKRPGVVVAALHYVRLWRARSLCSADIDTWEALLRQPEKAAELLLKQSHTLISFGKIPRLFPLSGNFWHVKLAGLPKLVKLSNRG